MPISQLLKWGRREGVNSADLSTFTAQYVSYADLKVLHAPGSTLTPLHRMRSEGARRECAEVTHANLVYNLRLAVLD